MNRCCLTLPEQAGTVMRNIARIFTRQVESRCGAKVVTNGRAPLTVELAVEKGIGAEGFRIADGKDGGVRIIGNDERGVLYGVGKFLRESRYDKGGFTPRRQRYFGVTQSIFLIISVFLGVYRRQSAVPWFSFPYYLPGRQSPAWYRPAALW